MEDILKNRAGRLAELYAQACLSRLCSSRGEFAALVGVSRQTMSSAMNGAEAYLTEKLIERTEAAVRGQNVTITMTNDDQAHDNVQKNFETQEGPQNDDVRAIVHDLTETLARERESHERIMLALIEKIGKKP